MTVKVLRADGGAAAGIVRALDQKGSPIGEARYTFAPRDRETEAAFDLPVELRNDIARLEISGERSAGAVQLLDKDGAGARSAWSQVSSNDTAQPLLASTFYLTRALGPFADVRLGDRGAPQQAIAQFLDQKLPMIVLADVGTLSPEIRERINAWIEQGGVLVRFAGPRLAQADDDLVPVKLRRGGRSLGGSLTWEKPQHLASFAADGPFTGLVVPKDITINRQVLAEPECGTGDEKLGVPRGRHAAGHRRASRQGPGEPVPRQRRTCAGPICRCPAPSSKLLRRIVDTSGYTSRPGAGVASEANVETVAPLRTLDGFGAFGPPPSTAKPLAADFRDRATLDHPPGFLWPRRRSARGEYAGGGGPHRAARYFRPARATRQLHQFRTAGLARHPVVVVAGAVSDRRCHRRPARRRHRRVAEATRGAGCVGVRPVVAHRADGAVAEAVRQATTISPSRRPRRPVWLTC